MIPCHCRMLPWSCPGPVPRRGSEDKVSNPPKKKTTGQSQAEAAPTNVAPWMQQPWMPVASTQQQHWMMGQANPWMMGQPRMWMMGQQFSGSWLQPQQTPVASTNEGPTTKMESEAKAAKRAIRKEMEEQVDARRNQGQNPHRVKVKAGGGIDGGCEGKNEFDEALSPQDFRRKLCEVEGPAPKQC